jgi:hypothetical protein
LVSLMRVKTLESCNFDVIFATIQPVIICDA